MRKIYILVLALNLGLAGCSQLGIGGSGFKLRSYDETNLKNGLRVVLVEDKKLPYFSLMMLVKSGSSADPARLKGLAYFVGELLDKGTNERNALQLSSSLEQMGAKFSVSVGSDYTLISGTSLSLHRERFLNDFAEMVTQPSFSSKEIKRARAQILAGLKKTVDAPDTLADRAFEKFLYGKHPYGASANGTIADVRRIRKKNIIKHYLEYYRPNRAILAVVGDYPDDIVEQLEKHFGKWERRDGDKVQLPEPQAVTALELQLIDKPGLKQSQIRLGHIGIERKDPDFLNLRLANAVLGGAFASRLMQAVRVEKGLTYGINSHYDARLQEGPFVINTFSRHDKVGETIQVTLQTLKKFREQGITDKELESAKALLKGIFPQALETAERLAENLLSLRFYGIPDTYLSKYLSRIESIEKEDVNRAIREHLHPDKLKIVVFSSRGKVLSQLKKIGKVKVKPYTDFL